MMKVVKNNKGQAAIEMGLALPFLVYLMYYTINAYHSLHTAHVGQRYAHMSVMQRLDNRAKFAVDGVANQAHQRGYIAVQYTDSGGGDPRRKIVLEPAGRVRIQTTVGICLDPGEACQ